MLMKESAPFHLNAVILSKRVKALMQTLVIHKIKK